MAHPANSLALPLGTVFAMRERVPINPRETVGYCNIVSLLPLYCLILATILPHSGPTL